MDITNENKVQPVRPMETATVHRIFLGTYLLIAAAALCVHFLLKYKVVVVANNSTSGLLAKLTLAACFAFLLLFVARIIERQLRKKAESKASRYNIIRFIRLLTVMMIIVSTISLLNSNWYATAVSLGLFSLILGFALQTPISSLIGWFYIIIRVPYRVGDRVQVGNFTGDVVEIGYLDTTLWEFAGNYMSNDLPSGRLVRFPNSLLFQSEIYNYSWHKFPYIWNEIPFHIAYESDLAFVETTIRRVATAQLGRQMEENIRSFREHLQQTPVDELEIKEYPFVQFRTNANTWIEVLLIYLVEPKKSGAVRSELIKSIIAALLQEPDRVLFPKSNAR